MDKKRESVDADRALLLEESEDSIQLSDTNKRRHSMDGSESLSEPEWTEVWQLNYAKRSKQPKKQGEIVNLEASTDTQLLFDQNQATMDEPVTSSKSREVDEVESGALETSKVEVTSLNEPVTSPKSREVDEVESGALEISKVEVISMDALSQHQGDHLTQISHPLSPVEMIDMVPIDDAILTSVKVDVPAKEEEAQVQESKVPNIQIENTISPPATTPSSAPIVGQTTLDVPAAAAATTSTPHPSIPTPARTVTQAPAAVSAPTTARPQQPYIRTAEDKVAISRLTTNLLVWFWFSVLGFMFLDHFEYFDPDGAAPLLIFIADCILLYQIVALTLGDKLHRAIGGDLFCCLRKN